MLSLPDVSLLCDDGHVLGGGVAFFMADLLVMSAYVRSFLAGLFLRMSPPGWLYVTAADYASRIAGVRGCREGSGRRRAPSSVRFLPAFHLFLDKTVDIR